MNTRFDTLTDSALIERVVHLVRDETRATASLVAHLGELEARELHLAAGYTSLFEFCTRGLHLSEHAAYLRITAARAAQRFPALLDALERGDVNLTSIRLLSPHLTPENVADVLAAARHRSKHEIEMLVARLHPRPDAPDSIRKLPARAAPPHPGASPLPAAREDLAAGGAAADLGAACVAAAASGSGEPSDATADPGLMAPDRIGANGGNGANGETGAARGARESGPAGQPARDKGGVSPLAPERYRIHFTAGGATLAKLRRAQELMWHQVPNGDLERVFDAALAALVEKLERRKLAATTRPRRRRRARSGSRSIPAWVRRAVHARDEGRCAFVGENGRRCNETRGVEFHHKVPFAAGGRATVENISLRCRAHNQHEARREFGPRRSAGKTRGP